MCDFTADQSVESGEKKQHEIETPKRAYQKPSFRYERVFETMALSCGKISPTQFTCRFNRKNS